MKFESTLPSPLYAALQPSSRPASETVGCVLSILLVAVPFQQGEVQVRPTCLMQPWSYHTGVSSQPAGDPSPWVPWCPGAQCGLARHQAVVAAIMSNDAVIVTAQSLRQTPHARHPAERSTVLGRSGAKIAHDGIRALISFRSLDPAPIWTDKQRRIIVDRTEHHHLR